MSFYASIVPQSKTLIHVDSPLLKLGNPKFILKSPTRHLHLQYNKEISIIVSALNIKSDVDTKGNSFNSTVTKWQEFASNVSGEWDGHGAEFTSEGKPVELPESVVPEAFREWEVQVFDWQTQCPTLAEPERPLLAYKLIKLLPTVGCEADAATRYNVDERNIGGVDNKASAFAYHSSGCYVAIWPEENRGRQGLLELEHCLVDPQNRESRVRIIQVVNVDETGFSLQSVKVFREQWYGPFRNGEQLGGCAIRDAAFASTDATKRSEVIGTWQSSNSVANFQSPQSNIVQELIDANLRNLVRDDDALILLPKNLWCSLKETEDGARCWEVGWLLSRGQAITSRCIFSEDRRLKEIAISQETAVAEEI